MARFTGGWVKLWRRAKDSDLGENVYLWAIWNWLLFTATWKPSSIIWNGSRRDIPSGTVVMGISELADKWDCSQATIKKWLAYLHASERIRLETCSRGTLVTILNWNTYQDSYAARCEPSENEVRTEWEPSENEVGLNEEVKKKRSNTLDVKYPPEFEETYRAYPRKQGKKRGFKIYERVIKTQEARARLLVAIGNYVAKNRQTEPQFLKHFDTFMGEWEDWLDPETGTVESLTPRLKPRDLEAI